MASCETSADTRSIAGLSETYARWRNSRLGRITDALEEHLALELLGPVDHLDVLDVGCGDGALASVLAHRGARVTGLDANPRMLAAARARAEAASVALDLVHGHAEALPFPDGAFDRVVAVTVLCFVHEPDRAIAEMVRVLKPGGRLVVGELGRWSLWAAIRRVRSWLGASTWRAARFRTAGDLQRLLEGHGLAVRETRGSIYYPPCGLGASLMAPVDPWLGQRTTLGAAFIVLSAAKPLPHTDSGIR
jgi:SAM-dependent methyltransferase